MEIVIEYVLIENLFIDLMIFKTTALVLKIKGRYFFFSFAFCFCICFDTSYLSSWQCVFIFCKNTFWSSFS